MRTIGLLSDTHGYLDEKIFHYFERCDEIWHAGDFGSWEVAEKLTAFKKFKGVYGNIDGSEIRKTFPHHQYFICEEVKIWMTHIGGYPGNYDKYVKDAIKINTPDLFICGHSHILKVMRDKNLNNMLHINPGAAGNIGMHQVRTIVRFSIDKKRIFDVEAIELGKRSI